MESFTNWKNSRHKVMAIGAIYFIYYNRKCVCEEDRQVDGCRIHWAISQPKLSAIEQHANQGKLPWGIVEEMGEFLKKLTYLRWERGAALKSGSLFSWKSMQPFALPTWYSPFHGHVWKVLFYITVVIILEGMLKITEPNVDCPQL